ncbi:MAG: hypothetical protein N2C13_06570, partial [Chloroflexota bacterium]
MKRLIFFLPLLLFACTSREEPVQATPTTARTAVPTGTSEPVVKINVSMTPTSVSFLTQTPFPIPTPDDFWSDFELSPNDLWIAFRGFTPAGVVFMVVASSDGEYRWTVNYDVYEHDGKEAWPTIMQWLVDGRYLYYGMYPQLDGGGYFAGQMDPQRIALNTGNIVKLMPDQPDGLYYWAISSKSDQLAFVNYSDYPQILVIRALNSGNEKPLDLELYDSTMGDILWSSDGSKIIFSTYDSKS